MKTNRRDFAKVAASGALATVLPAEGRQSRFSGLIGSAGPENPPVPKGIKIGNTIDPKSTDAQIASYRQCGVEFASVWTNVGNANYEYFKRLRDLYATHDIEIYNIGILDLHCDPTIVLQLPGYREKIEQYKQYVTDLGRAGVHYTTYAHMANIKMQPYFMTGRVSVRGGASTRFFDLNAAETLPLSHGRVYTEAEIWKSFTDFIRGVMPAAEKAGVRIGLHPDDPPVRPWAELPGSSGILRVMNVPSKLRIVKISASAYAWVPGRKVGPPWARIFLR